MRQTSTAGTHAEQQHVREQIETDQAAHFGRVGLDHVAHHLLVHDRAVGAREVRAERGDQEQRAGRDPQSEARRHEREQQCLQAHDHDEQGNQEQHGTGRRMPHRGDRLVPELQVVQHGPRERDDQHQRDVGAQREARCPTVTQPCVECGAERASTPMKRLEFIRCLTAPRPRPTRSIFPGLRPTWVGSDVLWLLATGAAADRHGHRPARSVAGGRAALRARGARHGRDRRLAAAAGRRAAVRGQAAAVLLADRAGPAS